MWHSKGRNSLSRDHLVWKGSSNFKIFIIISNTKCLLHLYSEIAELNWFWHVTNEVCAYFYENCFN